VSNPATPPPKEDRSPDLSTASRSPDLPPISLHKSTSLLIHLSPFPCRLPQNPKNQTHSPTRSASQSHDSPTLSYHNPALSYPNATLSSHNPAKSSQKPLPPLRPSNLSRCQTLIPPSNTNPFQSSTFNLPFPFVPSVPFVVPHSAIRNPQ
jgi:hypothetical protein